MNMETNENETGGAALAAAPVNGKRAVKTLQLKPGLSTDYFTITERGIDLRASMPQQDWLNLAEKGIADFEKTRDTHLIAMFRIGDILAYGEREYGEEYAQAIDGARQSIRLSMKTLQNVQSICRSVRPAARHELLTLSHHEAVAKLPEEHQIRLLDKAQDEELTVAGLKKVVKEEFPKPGGGSQRTAKVVVDLESEEGLMHATEKAVEFLAALDEKDTPEYWTKERQAKWFPTITRLFAIFAPADEIAREGAREIAAYLDNPDNGPLKSWSDRKRRRWADPLSSISKAARRMGVGPGCPARDKPSAAGADDAGDDGAPGEESEAPAGAQEGAGE